MREARIILPLRGNDGRDLAEVHQHIKHSLALAFGGYTAIPVTGGWVTPSGQLVEEPGTAYDVACEDSAEAALRMLASVVGHKARQDAIYLRLPNGRAEIIDLKAPHVAAA